MSAKTLYTLLQQQLERRPGVVAALCRHGDGWRHVSWEELGRSVREIALGLLTLDLKRGDRVALISRASVEQVAVDLAAQACGAIAVPLLHRLSADEWLAQIKRAGCEIVFVDSGESAAALLARRDAMPGLRALIQIEHQASERGGGAGPVQLSLAALRQRGAGAADARSPLLERRLAQLEAGDVSAVMFTVGATERTKAVAISHDAMTYQVEALARLDLVGRTDVLLLCMPLAHAFSRAIVGLWLRIGHTIAFSDLPAELLEGIEEVQPTVLAAPPRVFELIYGTIVRSGQDARGPRSRLFAWAMSQARNRILKEVAGATPTQPGWIIARRAVFDRLGDRLRRLFGGRVRLFITGGAPLADRIAYFFSYAGVTIHSSYGLTESCGISCVNSLGRDKIGTVGPPLPGTEVRIADNGEILLRGRGMMLGYWDEPEKGLSFDDDGFLRTGDAGELDVDGYLRVTGRLADLITMRDGTVVAPHSVEMALRTNAFIGHALVDGNGGRELVALISLDPETLEAWAHARHLRHRDFPDLARSPEVRRMVQAVIDDRNRRFGRGRGIKRFAIIDHPFTIGDELTATMRLRRGHVRQKYRITLDALHGVDEPGEP